MNERTIRECKYHGLTEFAWYDHWRCLLCTAESKRQHRRKMKGLLIERLGGKCQICGYNKYQGALEFHHLEPSKKDFNLASKGWMAGYKTLLEESDKCLLVCANCHREIEAGLHCGVEELVDSPVSETGVL